VERLMCPYTFDIVDANRRCYYSTRLEFWLSFRKDFD